LGIQNQAVVKKLEATSTMLNSFNGASFKLEKSYFQNYAEKKGITRNFEGVQNLNKEINKTQIGYFRRII
jgi:hypothetical protein